jgi:hypothetical protein
MNKLRALLVAAALLTAACGATTISGSQVKSVSPGELSVGAGANAGSAVSTGTENDLGPANRTPSKPSSGPAPVQQSQAPAPAATSPSVVTPDRCNSGVWPDHDAGNRSSTGSVTHPPLPACAMQ